MPTLADYPHLVVQLARRRNGRISPEAFTAGSGRKLFWRCKAGPDHAWEASVIDRIRGSGCPFCANQRASVTNSLASVAPTVAAQWHPKKNGATVPSEVVASSAK